MKDISKRQIGFIKGLAKKQGMEVSGSELESLTYDEANRMIRSLTQTPESTPEQKRKNKIISMAKTIGWTKPDGKINMNDLNDWCVKRGMYHKTLDEHTAQELVHLVSQFQIFFKYKLSKKDA